MISYWRIRQQDDNLTQFLKFNNQQGIIAFAWSSQRIHYQCIAYFSIDCLYMNFSFQSLKSRGYVKEQVNWRHKYYFLTNEGITYLREYLNLPEGVVPATVKTKPREIRLPLGDRAPRPCKLVFSSFLIVAKRWVNFSNFVCTQFFYYALILLVTIIFVQGLRGNFPFFSFPQDRRRWARSLQNLWEGYWCWTWCRTSPRWIRTWCSPSSIIVVYINVVT